MCALCNTPVYGTIVSSYCVAVCGMTVFCLKCTGIRYNCVLLAVPVYGINVCCLQFAGILYKLVLFEVYTAYGIKYMVFAVCRSKL